MKIAGLCCTNGRFSYLKRVLSFFLTQSHENKILVIFNNSEIAINIVNIPNVLLINNYIDYTTHLPYQNVGAIFRDALSHVPTDVDYVSIMDDDDIYFPDHFSSAASIFKNNDDVVVWQPSHFYFKKTAVEVEYKEISGYNLEPSSIVKYDFISKEGFNTDSSLTYHLKWLNKAKQSKKYFVDQNPLHHQFCYEFGQTKILNTSAYATINDENAKKEIDTLIQKYNDYGKNEILTPWTQTKTKEFYDFILKLNQMNQIVNTKKLQDN